MISECKLFVLLMKMQRYIVIYEQVASEWQMDVEMVIS